MQSWARSYQAILLKSGLRLTDHSGYVDDGRRSGTTLRRGMKYDKSRKMFLQDAETRKDDDERNEPNSVRMARVCKDAMNDVNADLQEMRTPYVIMKRSAMSEHQRISILSNKLIRRLSNVTISIVQEEMHEIIEHYITQLKLLDIIEN